MSGTFVSVHDFRKKLEEYLLYAEQPVVITRRQMPVGYFIPAKIWYGKENVENFRKLVSATLEAAGYSEQDVDDSIEEFVRDSTETVRKRLGMAEPCPMPTTRCRLRNETGAGT